MSTVLLDGTLTLGSSKYLESMVTLVKHIRQERNLYTTDKVNELIDMCRVGNVDFGKGIINNVILSPLDVKDLQNESTLLTPNLPAVGQEMIMIDKYKTVKVSTREIVGVDAFLDGSAVSTFLTAITELLETSKNTFLLESEVLPMINGWKPPRASQTLDIELYKEDGLEGIDLQSVKAMNASLINKSIRKLINNMKLPAEKYTDVEEYTDPNSGLKRKVKTQFDSSECTFLANDKFYTDYLGDALAPLPNGNELSGMFPAKTKILPESGVSSENAMTVGWIFKDRKFAMADFYNISFSFFDGSNLYNHVILHFAYGNGVFKYLPAVKIVAHYKA